jgi:poly(3-hydroxybutyrate) depolymerase
VDFDAAVVVNEALAPARAVSDAARTWLEHPGNPLSYTAAGRNLVASAKIFERLTRRYKKPAFDLATTVVDGKIVPIIERVAWERPFCKLLHFEKQFDAGAPEPQQKLLIVAPLSGHHATLLRGTVEAFLPFYDVYITDWADARTIPLSSGWFDLDDYIDYVIAICETLSKVHDREIVHTIGVCQPAVPLIAAIALMEARESPHVPASMTLMGGPIDTRRRCCQTNRSASAFARKVQTQAAIKP